MRPLLALLILSLLPMSLASVAQAPAVGAPRPFRVSFEPAQVQDLRERLRRARLPAQMPAQGWQRGTDSEALRDLLRYWADGYDFSAAERRLNAWPQFQVEIDGLVVHYQHVRAKGARRMPLLVLHGWPSSFVQFHPLLPLLTDPASHGGGADALAFDVVSVSLPGFGFSANPLRPGFAVRDMARHIHALMTQVLGYPRYAVRGSDIGAVVQQQLSLLYPQAIIGNHVSGTLRGAPLPPRAQLGESEQKYLADNDAWSANELAYANLHASKPQTIGNALNDSPAGLASWILEKFHGWSDPQRSLDARFGRDALIDNLMVYWLTGSITSSMHFYFDFRREADRATGRVEAPTAVLMGMLDMVPPPRALMERQYRVARWNEVPRGGHFLEWEEPQLVARDLREFFEAFAVP